MKDILDIPVPRTLVDRVQPEGYVTVAEIEELGDRGLVGSLRRIPRDDVGVHEAALTERGYKWISLLSVEHATVLYSRQIAEQTLQMVRLQIRDLSLEEPPLSIREHLKLADCFGVPEETKNRFKTSVLFLMEQEGLIPKRLEEEELGGEQSRN